MKKCYCTSFEELQYEPDKVIERKVCGDKFTQVNFDVESETEYDNYKSVTIELIWSAAEIATEQRNDININPVFEFIESEQEFNWTNFSHCSVQIKLLFMERKWLQILNNLLYRKWETLDESKYWFKLIVPGKYRNDILKQLHDSPSSGHNRIRRTYLKMRARYFWPHMRQFIQRWISTCRACQLRKGPSQNA